MQCVSLDFFWETFMFSASSVTWDLYVCRIRKIKANVTCPNTVWRKLLKWKLVSAPGLYIKHLELDSSFSEHCRTHFTIREHLKVFHLHFIAESGIGSKQDLALFIHTVMHAWEFGGKPNLVAASGVCMKQAGTGFWPVWKVNTITGNFTLGFPRNHFLSSIK